MKDCITGKTHRIKTIKSVKHFIETFHYTVVKKSKQKVLIIKKNARNINL